MGGGGGGIGLKKRVLETGGGVVMIHYSYKPNFNLKQSSLLELRFFS